MKLVIFYTEWVYCTKCYTLLKLSTLGYSENSHKLNKHMIAPTWRERK